MVAEVLQFVRNGKTVLKDFMNGLDFDKIKMLSLCRFSQEKHYALLEKVYGQQLIVE